MLSFFKSLKIPTVQCLLTIVKKHAKETKRKTTTACLSMSSLNKVHFKAEICTSQFEECCMVSAGHTDASNDYERLNGQ